ncbi:MAG: LysM peptidoglycan-binding domain-containing protein [Bacteroidales bacterium]|nr:LysM peptidoglycan-binding domain-containing protein [Bacteroidales bacterium]
MKRLLILLAALAAFSYAEAFAQDYVPTPVTVSREKVRYGGKIYLSHVVLERQTIYGICKAYGVSEDELYEANPTLRETGLQKNAILLVPFHEQSPVAAEPESPATEPDAEAVAVPDTPVRPVKSYIEHTVRWYEDIDDIAKKYGVTVKDIMDANGLASQKLSTRQLLKIPVFSTEDEPVQESPLENVPENTVETPEEMQELPDSVQTQPVIVPQGFANFSLVLPLKAGERNMDFYSGALLALRDLEEEGVTAQVHVYDLNAGIPPIDELVKDDFVLGPVASRDLEAILQRVDGRVPIISPLDPKASALSANYSPFVQAPSAVDYQYADLAAWLKEDLQEDERVILVTEKGASNINASIAIRSAMAKEGLSYEILNYAIVERSVANSMMSLFAPKGKTTRVVVASESEAFVADAVRKLAVAKGKGYEVVMYAPSKVRSFDTIDGASYHSLSLHVSATYFIDYDNPGVARFVRTYRALFRTEPTPFAFQGYDTVRYFVSQVLRCGKAWTSFPDEKESTGLQADFLLVKDENGNLHNEAVRRIIFEKDYTTTLQR